MEDIMALFPVFNKLFPSFALVRLPYFDSSNRGVFDRVK